MQFVSLGFAAFLAAVFVLYYLLPKRFQWILLLIASYVFYFFAGKTYLIFITVTSVTVYLLGRRIGALSEEQSAYLKAHKAELSAEEKKAYKAGIKKKKRTALLVGLLINLGILAALKYTNFAVRNINSVLSAFGAQGELQLVDFVLPMGISFYTFQAVGYLIDVWRGNYPPEKSLPKFMLFVSFFPQLIQGPISRFNDLSQTLYAPHDFDKKGVTNGFRRVLWGYFKKMVIADRLLTAVTGIIDAPDVYGGIFVFIGMLLYAVELYADFTGGIDITIGIAEMFGIKVKENFDRPYLSKNIEEYWRRWHITMGTWFRDYIFYPLSASKPMLKFVKKSRAALGDGFGKRLPLYVSTLIVWFATGIWHGASWNFIVWGLLNGFVIIISQELQPFYAWFHAHVKVEGTKIWDAFRVVRTFVLMCFIRSLDCYPTVGTTFKMMGEIFLRPNFAAVTGQAFIDLGLGAGDYIVAAVGVVAMTAVSLVGIKRPVRDRLSDNTFVNCASFVVLALAIVIFGAYGIDYDASRFIYGQF